MMQAGRKRMFIGGNRYFFENRFAGQAIYSQKPAAAVVAVSKPAAAAVAAVSKPAATDQAQTTVTDKTVQQARLGVLALSLAMLFLK